MTITINLPKTRNDQLQEQVVNTEQLADDTKQALAFDLYQQGKLSLGQVSTMLNLHFDKVLGLMKERGIYLNYSLADLEHDLSVVDKLMQK